MKRRDFIRLGGFLTVSAATLGMTGCDIDGEDDDQSLFPSPTPEPVRPMPAAATGANWQFPQGIASADPRAGSIILWTRVVPTGLTATESSSTNAAIRLIVTADNMSADIGTTTDMSGATLVADVTVASYADFDNSIRHKLTGLNPASVYFYQFIAGDVRSNVGRFKTAPAASSSDDVKFIFMSCQDWSANHWGAFDQIVADDATPADPDVDFIVHLGDYIYETASAGAAEGLHSAVSLPSGEDYAIELTDYRHLYKLFRSDTRIQAVHERFPIVAVWDDHEFSDDSWQVAETYTTANTPMFERRRNANRAWFEYMPADISFSEVDPGFQNIRIYRDLKFGTTMHLVMTDERLYRQDHLIPETASPRGRIFSRYLAPEASLMSAELQKEASLPNLALISILGQTQRDWWKSTMVNSTSTWKVWGNEVSLLRMGLNGTNAIATLIALGSVPTLATNIGNTAAALTGGNVPVAAAIVGAATFGATTPNPAAAAATAIATLDGTSGGTATPAQLIGAAMGQGLTQTQATVAVTAYLAAKSAAAGGATAQATTAAGAIAIGTSVTFDAADVAPCIRNDIRTNKNSSVFFLAAVGGSAAALAPFFQKFVINADQWDGYRKERANLMSHLRNNNVENVVAVTGDIHAFFAGEVYDEFAGEVTGLDGSTPVESTGGEAVMVDLVVAGISSTSLFNYFKDAADGLDPTNSLIGKLVYVPVAVPASGPFPGFTVNLDLLDYTLGKSLSSNSAVAAGQVASQLADQIKRQLALFGVPDANIDATASAYITNIASNPAFASAVGLAMQLSTLGRATNPWLKHVTTEAQGYAVVTASTGQLQCQFKKLNPIVGATAPSSARRVVSTTTATVTAGTPAVVIS